MPLIHIDGREIQAKDGQTIIEAAHEAGITIPHFCWHPALSVAGNCRMCLVNVGMHKKGADGALQFSDDGAPEIGWMPKMQIACATYVSDGMHVDTISKKTEGAQNAVMEFLLINHPLDCPICDEAGQCKLQEYAYNHSNGQSRFDEVKTHKDKRVELGPQIMFDGERCISCSRCIRFAEEVAEQPVLSFVQRGDKVTIRTFPGTTFDSPYSMNVIDICPVGALTSMDFRFKARVWEMSFTDSVCPGCARGCNVSIGVMNNEVLRTEPRTNMHVNTYWMCDHGRLAMPGMVNENRVSGPKVRRDGMLVDASWDEALEAATQALKGLKSTQVAVIGSAKASNEDNYLLAQFAHKVLGSHDVDVIKHIDHDFADSKLRVNETAPNAIGAHEVGMKPASNGHKLDQLAGRIRHGDVKAVVILADSADSYSVELAEAFAELDHLIVIDSHMSITANQATVLLPLSSWAETEGTFTNMLHRVQHFLPAVATQENARYMGLRMSRWDKFGAPNDRWTDGERRDVRPGWKIVQSLAKAMGADWSFKNAREVFKDLAEHQGPFHGMSYDKLDEHQGLILGKADHPEPVGVVYDSHVMKPQ